MKNGSPMEILILSSALGWAKMAEDEGYSPATGSTTADSMVVSGMNRGRAFASTHRLRPGDLGGKLKYTITDKERKLDIVAESPEAAAQQWADNFDWTGIMIAFNRCTVRTGDTVVGEFSHARFAAVEYHALLPAITATWNADLGRYEIPCGGGFHDDRIYISENGEDWKLMASDGTIGAVGKDDEFFRMYGNIRLTGGPKDGALAAPPYGNS
jgi:hypothetical protein